MFGCFIIKLRVKFSSKFFIQHISYLKFFNSKSILNSSLTWNYEIKHVKIYSKSILD